MSERETGHYWLTDRADGELTIGQWNRGWGWTLFGSDYVIEDDALVEDYEIGERVVPPDSMLRAPIEGGRSTISARPISPDDEPMVPVKGASHRPPPR